MFCILSLIVIIVTKVKLKASPALKEATGLRTLNLVTLILMIATTVFSVLSMAASLFSALVFAEASAQAPLLIMFATILLGMLLITVLLSVWQIKLLKKLKVIIAEQAEVSANANAAPENESATPTNVARAEDNKRNVAFFLAVATTPVLFIIRMLSQTTEHVNAGEGGAWKSYDRTVVPGNIQAVMFVLLAASIGISAYLRKTSKSKNYSKSTLTTVLSVINALLGMILIFMAL